MILLIPSKDGDIRVAKVVVGKTRQIIERAVNKLYLIEFSVENTNVEPIKKNNIKQCKNNDFKVINAKLKEKGRQP